MLHASAVPPYVELPEGAGFNPDATIRFTLSCSAATDVTFKASIIADVHADSLRLQLGDDELIDWHTGLVHAWGWCVLS